MSYLQIDSRFKMHALALSVGMCFSTSVFAMQALDDEGLSEATGEGLAFAVNDFSLRLNGADNEPDTGYIRLIPVGAQSKIINDHNNATANVNGTDAEKSRAKYDINIGKGDAYVYGLAISENDGDANTRFSGNTVNIGSYANPWMIASTTETYPNFAGTPKPVSALVIEAPTFSYQNDPYDLKVGAWLDAFVRDPSIEEGNAAEFQLNGATRSGTTYDDNLNPVIVTGQTRENRLRLQAVINGASLNGTKVQVFQTLDGATNAGGLSTSYNQTLGLAATVRLNMGDSTGLKVGAKTSDNVVTNPSTYTSGWNTIHAGSDPTFGSSGSGCSNGGAGSFSTAIGCQYIVQNRARTDTKTQTAQFAMPSGLNDHVVRLSSRETTNTDVLKTPALDGGAAPTFAADEGLYLYQPNINVVLGTPWQPLVLGVADDDRNLVLELTRIPNVAAVYKEIYTDYSGADASYKGGTCSLYWCGDSSKNATHSSITIGTTNPYTTVNGVGLLTAYTGSDAIGVSFGALDAPSSRTTRAVVSEARYAQRALSDQTWRQRYYCSDTGWFGNCDDFSTVTGHLYQWEYNTGSGYTTPNATSTPPNAPTCTGNGCNNTSGSTPMYGSTANRNWSDSALHGAAWQTGSNSTVNNFIGAANGITGTIPNQAPTPSAADTPLNNLGSAVIDGLLIQHLKLTTKGL